jgi:hypothetical protein
MRWLLDLVAGLLIGLPKTTDQPQQVGNLNTAVLQLERRCVDKLDPAAIRFSNHTNPQPKKNPMKPIQNHPPSVEEIVLGWRFDPATSGMNRNLTAHSAIASITIILTFLLLVQKGESLILKSAEVRKF